MPKSNASIEDYIKAAFAELDKNNPVPEGFEVIGYRNPLENEGDTLQGEYLDKTVKPLKGKPVNCYRIKNDGGIHVVLGAAQLDTFFDSINPGMTVWLQRGPEIKAGAHGRVTVYRTAVRK